MERRLDDDGDGGGASTAEVEQRRRGRRCARAEEEQEREEERAEQSAKKKRSAGSAASIPPRAAFIAARGGRLASKWRTWPRRPDFLRHNSAHVRCGYQKLPHHVPHDRTGSGGDSDVTRRTGGRAITSDRSSRVRDPRRRRLRRAASRSRTLKFDSAQNLPSKAETSPRLVRKRKLHKCK